MTRHLEERALWLSRHVLPHEAALRAWLRRKPPIGLEIDDIVQETYARLASLDSVEQVRDGKTYAFQTAQSIIVSHIRRARIIPIRAVANIEELGAIAPAASPEQAVEDRDELQRLAELIATLPAKAREVIILRRVEGLSQRETAGRLGVSEKTVEKHMGRAIRVLMDSFGRGGKTPPKASKPESNQRIDHEKADFEPTN